MLLLEQQVPCCIMERLTLCMLAEIDPQTVDEPGD